MAGDSRSRISWIPIAWTVACLLVLGVAFFAVSWPYVDVHNNLREATSWDWRQVTFATRSAAESNTGRF